MHALQIVPNLMDCFRNDGHASGAKGSASGGGGGGYSSSASMGGSPDKASSSGSEDGPYRGVGQRAGRHSDSANSSGGSSQEDGSTNAGTGRSTGQLRQPCSVLVDVNGEQATLPREPDAEFDQSRLHGTMPKLILRWDVMDLFVPTNLADVSAFRPHCSDLDPCLCPPQCIRTFLWPKSAKYLFGDSRK